MLIIGHRGAAGICPENTRKSFNEAVKRGVDMIELDVRLCATGELVVFHDETLERTTNGRGLLAEKTLNELKSLDAGEGQQILGLEEVLEEFGNRVKINVELKGAGTAGPVCGLIKRFAQDKNLRLENLLISSFLLDELRRVRAMLPEMAVAPLFSRLPGNFHDLATKLQAFSVNLSLHGITRKDVEQVHEAGFKVLVYTVNSKKAKKRMQAWGVDGIFTDFP